MAGDVDPLRQFESIGFIRSQNEDCRYYLVSGRIEHPKCELVFGAFYHDD